MIKFLDFKVLRYNCEGFVVYQRITVHYFTTTAPINGSEEPRCHRWKLLIRIYAWMFLQNADC